MISEIDLQVCRDSGANFIHVSTKEMLSPTYFENC